jgi:hypothetical protein
MAETHPSKRTRRRTAASQRTGNPVYETRATLFLDILGFRSLITEGREAELLRAFQMLPQYMLPDWGGDWDDIDFQATAFSDCIVCSAKILSKSNYIPAAFVCLCAGQLALGLLENGIVTRGAVTVGSLYHQGNIVFGPALVEAYELESRIAVYPRIVALPKVYGKINLSLAVVHGADWFLKNEPFREDFDGIWHLDVLGPFFMRVRPIGLLPRQNISLETVGPVTKSVIHHVCKKKYRRSHSSEVLLAEVLFPGLL